MLGYVVSYKPEMKVKEAELYKAYYCGICKSIGRRYGQLPRMVLSYDAAFLAVMLDSLYDMHENLTRERCIANPLKKKAVASSEAIDFAADIMLILAWHKLIDDADDEGNKVAGAVSKLMEGKYEQLKSDRPAFCRDLEEHMAMLRELEVAKCANLDQAAEAFAKIMEDIFAEGLKTVNEAYEMEAVYDEFQFEAETENDIPTQDLSECKSEIDMKTAGKILSRIGYHLGKWIYLMDAYDDIDDNITTGAYNPLIYRFEYKQGEEPQKFRQRIKEDVERNLIMYLAEMAKAVDLLEINKNKGIIENIIYVGLLKKTEEVLEKGENDNE